MPVEYEMPELAESVIEGEIVKWLVNEGDHVKEDQPLVEVMTDKVTVEIPSPFAGILLKQVAKEGEVVPIGKPIAIFGKEGETLADHGASKAQPRQLQRPVAAELAQPKTPADSAKPSKAKTGNGQAGTVAPSESAILGPQGRPMAAPAVRKFAREKGVDLNNVRGSGEGGRIRREDVERVAAGATSVAAEPARPSTPARPLPAPSGETERVPLRGLRRVIAEHMVHSKQTAAHTLHVDEADVTELVAMRARAQRSGRRTRHQAHLPAVLRQSGDATRSSAIRS